MDFREIIQQAEHAVKAVKDPTLRAVAFGKVLDALMLGATAPGSKREARPRSSGGVKRFGTAGYLQELVQRDYFGEQRTLGDLKRELANGGHHVPLTSLSGPMQDLCRRRVLRREKRKTSGKKETFVYSNW